MEALEIFYKLTVGPLGNWSIQYIEFGYKFAIYKFWLSSLNFSTYTFSDNFSYITCEINVKFLSIV